jgi:hypothetical protein
VLGDLLVIGHRTQLSQAELRAEDPPRDAQDQLGSNSATAARQVPLTFVFRSRATQAQPDRQGSGCRRLRPHHPDMSVRICKRAGVAPRLLPRLGKRPQPRLCAAAGASRRPHRPPPPENAPWTGVANASDSGQPSALEMSANACPFGVTRHPALSLPCCSRTGFRLGLMLVGRRMSTRNATADLRSPITPAMVRSRPSAARHRTAGGPCWAR